MEYKQSEDSKYRERVDKDWPDGVHIRQQDVGIITYAVFDGEEQVSEDVAAIQDEHLIWFADGYARAKERYDNNRGE